jgi:nucleoside-diphosphate-sugar epimerase/predicted dehydrogenase
MGLKYLVLGGGAVVAEFYLPAFSALGWLDDVWVADPSTEALDRLRKSYPELKGLELDFRAALDRGRDRGIQAAIIALPNALHEAAVIHALDCGFDVLCEKPLALTEPACRQLADHAARSGRVVGVGMTRRFLPSTKILRGILDAGWLGQLTSIELQDGHNFAWSSESGAYGRVDNAGVLANIGVHALDLIESLCGPLTPANYTDDWRGGVEANATFDLETSRGAPVHLKFSYTHALASGLRIRGARGEIWHAAEATTVRYHDAERNLFADVSASPSEADRPWPAIFQSAMRDEFVDFRDAIVTRRPPLATPEQAARTAALIDWAYSQHSAQRLAAFGVSSTRPRLEAGRVVITGGTGFVGGHLIEALAAEGHHDLVVPVRTYQRSANCWRFPVQLQRADLLDPASVRQVLNGARYVFHLAYGRDGENAARVTVEGTRNVLEAAIDVGAECAVVLSTTAVFGDPGGSRTVDESFPYDPPPREYERTKAEAERVALDIARRRTGTRIVVVNPACIYGPGGRTFTELPARLLRDGEFCWIEDGRGVVNYVYVANLVDAILRATVHVDARGERFIVSDGCATWREFFTELLGSAVRDLPSYTQAELARLDRQRRPSLRDVARTVVQSDKLWPMVSQNPQLATTKAILEKMTPGLYQRVKGARATGRTLAAGVAHTAPGLPPLFLGDLFGVLSTRLTSAKAQRVLGWKPQVDLPTGQRASRRWLEEMNLLVREPETPWLADSRIAQ